MWNVPTEREVAEGFYDACDKHEIQKGSDCAYARLDELWGVKTYKSRNEMVTNHMFQHMASLHFLAPPVAHKFYNLYWPNGREVYGFLTMNAELVFQDWEPEDMEEDKEYLQLCRNMRLAGFRHAVADLHEMNVGLFDNRLVCIDFSRMMAAGFQSRKLVANRRYE